MKIYLPKGHSELMEFHISEKKKHIKSSFCYTKKLTKNNFFLKLERFEGTIVTNSHKNKPKSQKYFESQFSSNNFDLKTT